MKKITILVGATLLFWAAFVGAHGPVRQKMKETIDINAAPEEIWKIMGDYQDMSWLPMVEKTTGEGGNEKGAKRELTLKDGGGTVKEELKKYDADKMQYKYKITEMSTVKTFKHLGKEEAIKVLPVSTYSADISVKASKSGGSTVTWKAAFYRAYMNNNPPPELNEEAAVAAVTGVFKAGLENLKTLAEGK